MSHIGEKMSCRKSINFLKLRLEAGGLTPEQKKEIEMAIAYFIREENSCYRCEVMEPIGEEEIN